MNPEKATLRLPIRIRFVGGCWHNLLPEMKEISGVVTSSDDVHVYYLAEFYSDYGTPYYQYIHASLTRGDKIHPGTFRERFPEFNLKVPRPPSKPRHRLSQAFKQN